MNKNKRIILLSIVLVAVGLFIGNIAVTKKVGTSLKKQSTNVLLTKVKDFYKVGEIVKIHDMSMTINKIKISTGTKTSRTDKGLEYLIVTVTIKNGSNSKRNYGNDFQLQDAKGQVTDSIVTMIDADQTFTRGDLVPNEKVTGTMTFLAAKGAKGLSLNYIGDIFGHTVVHFKLN